MAGVSYIIDDSDVHGVLSLIARKAERPEDALHAIGGYGVFSTQRRFETERDPSGQPWTPLSRRTANQRIGRGRRGPGHILRVSNRLYQSIAYDVSPGQVEWGSNVIYARIHQMGGVIDIAAREQRLTLKRTRRKGGGFRSRFARAGAKGATERVVKVGAHQIKIPARPYLGLSEEDVTAINEVVADYFRAEAGGK